MSKKGGGYVVILDPRSVVAQILIDRGDQEMTGEGGRECPILVCTVYDPAGPLVRLETFATKERPIKKLELPHNAIALVAEYLEGHDRPFGFAQRK